MTAATATGDTLARHLNIARDGIPSERDAIHCDPRDNGEGPRLMLDTNRSETHKWRTVEGGEVINLATGEVRTMPAYAFVKDGCMTITKLGEQLDMGQDLIRAFLLSIGLLHPEIVVRYRPSRVDPRNSVPEYSNEARASEWACKMLHARRVKSSKGFEFDLITPAGIAYAVEMNRLQIAIASETPKSEVAKLKPKDSVAALLDATPTLRVADIVKATGLPQASVSRHVAAWKANVALTQISLPL